MATPFPPGNSTLQSDQLGEIAWEAIRSLRVRGAPAIGIAAAYSVCLGLQSVADAAAPDFLSRLHQVVD